MFCSKCGQQIDNSAAFCPRCGTPNSAVRQNDTDYQPQESQKRDIPQNPEYGYAQNVEQRAFSQAVGGVKVKPKVKPGIIILIIVSSLVIIGSAIAIPIIINNNKNNDKNGGGSAQSISSKLTAHDWIFHYHTEDSLYYDSGMPPVEIDSYTVYHFEEDGTGYIQMAYSESELSDDKGKVGMTWELSDKTLTMTAEAQGSTVKLNYCDAMDDSKAANNELSDMQNDSWYASDKYFVYKIGEGEADVFSTYQK